MSVDEREREKHHSSAYVNSRETLEKHLKENTWGKKKYKECYGTSATQEMLGTMSSMENAFLHLRHIEFRTTELYVYYS